MIAARCREDAPMHIDLENARAYEAYIGRWSRVVAAEFVRWLDIPARARWLDVACGTGALTHAIVEAGDPSTVDASDASAAAIAYARQSNEDARVTFRVVDAKDVGGADGAFDAVVAGLPFPAVSEPARFLAELKRATRSGGTVGIYVWDFDGEMQMLRYFWDAATTLDPTADESDSDERFAVCDPDRLADALRSAGFGDITVRAITVPTRFRDFADYWEPFSVGGSAGQKHVQSLSPDARAVLRERLRSTLPIEADGSIHLHARAWAVKGRKT